MGVIMAMGMMVAEVMDTEIMVAEVMDTEVMAIGIMVAGDRDFHHRRQ